MESSTKFYQLCIMNQILYMEGKGRNQLDDFIIVQELSLCINGSTKLKYHQFEGICVLGKGD